MAQDLVAARGDIDPLRHGSWRAGLAIRAHGGRRPARCLGMYLKKKKREVCATRAVRVATMGRGVASTMQPAAQMPVPPPRAQGEDGVASLWRTLGRAAPTALDGPFAERVLTARRERSGGCRPVGAQ